MTPPSVNCSPGHESADAARTLIPAFLIHAVPGRLRLRIEYLRQDRTYGVHLQQQIQSLTGVISIRVNPEARSIVVDYQVHIGQETQTQAELLQFLQDVCNLQVQFAKDSLPATAIVTTVVTEPLVSPEPAVTATESFPGIDLSPREIESKLKEIGGAVLGGAAGDMVGGAIGGAAGAAVMGPPGAILGSQMGVFVGGVIGAKLGAETITQLDQIQSDPAASSELLSGKVSATLKKRAGEKIGETTGELVGGMVGRVVLGPTGEIVGTIVGGAIAGQLGEDALHQQPAETTEVGKAATPEEMASKTESWLEKTAKGFVGETASATIGGALGSLALGPQGKEVGMKLGNRISRFIDWEGKEKPPPGKASPELPPPTS